MKKFITVLAGAALMFAATSAMAAPILPAGYEWNSAAFWTNTDKTTANSGFEIRLENAGYESDFGIFSVNDITNPTSIVKEFEIFKYTDNADAINSVYFQNVGGTTQVKLNTTGSWTDFSSAFGFYYGIHTGGASDPTVDYKYYSYKAFNAPSSETNTDHIMIATNINDPTVIRIFLDDQLSTTPGNDHDFDDMTVSGNDLTPVPEPGTVVLLGAGLLSLGLFGRRRMKK